MAASKRIYAVKVLGPVKGDVQEVLNTRLVRASTQAGAVAHVVKGQVNVSLPTQEELIAYGGEGLKIEDAS